MSAQRAAARIARRELRRRPVTTLLVALLVAVPVAAMVVSTVLVRSQGVPVELRDQAAVGNADASLSVAAPRSAEARRAIEAAAPEVTISELQASSGWLGPPGAERLVASVTGGDFGDPLVRDRFVVTDGRMPSTAGEIALSPTVADAWQAHPGDVLDLPDLGTTGEVVGIASVVTAGQRNAVFVGSFPDLDPATVTVQLFVDERYGLDRDAVAELQRLSNGTGTLLLATHVEPVDGVAYTVANRSLESPSVIELYVAGVWGGGALTLAVMGIVISSAFAIGARRQLRTLGLLAANGAPPRVIRASVIWQGLWVGVVGTVGGLAVGALALVLWPDSWLAAYAPAGWVWMPRDLLPIAALGILAPAAAAYLPARSASRVSVLRALAGRRPLHPVRPRLILGGLASAAGGVVALAAATVGLELKPWRQNVWIALGIAGGLAVLAGAVTASPVVVGMAGSLARRAGGTTKLALRSIGRQRSRFGPVVAGIAAAAALCLVVSAGVRTSEVQDERRRPQQADDIVKVDAWGSTTVFPPSRVSPDGASGGFGVAPTYAAVTSDQLAAIAAVVPGAVRIDTPVAAVGATDSSTRDDTISTYLNRDAPVAAPASDALLDAMGATADVRAAIARGETVAIGAPAELHQVTLTGRLGNPYPAVEGATGYAAPRTPMAVTPFPDLTAWNSLPTVLLPTTEAERVGLTGAPPWDAASLFVAPDALTADQTSALRALVEGQYAPNGDFRLAAEPTPEPSGLPEMSVWYPGTRRSHDQGQSIVLVALAGVAFLFTALVVVLGLALAARDTRDERDVLEAIGAPPRMLRRLAGARAGVLAALGAVVAVPTALVPVWVVDRASTPVVHFAMPWASVVALVVAIPIAIGVLALAGGALTSRFRPANASLFSAD